VWWGQPRGGRGGGGGETPRGPTEARSKKRRAPRGGGGQHVVGWEEERVGEHRVATSADWLRRGVVGRSREVARGGGVRPGCSCGPTGRGGANVCHGGCGGRDTPVQAARHATPVWRGADPVRGPTSTTPLGRGSRGGGWRLLPAPGQGAGPEPPPQGSSRDGQGRHVTRRGSCLAVGGLTVGRGVAPQLCTAHPRGPSPNIPIQASKGMICPDLGEIGFGRERGFSPVVFPTLLLLV